MTTLKSILSGIWAFLKGLQVVLSLGVFFLLLLLVNAAMTAKNPPSVPDGGIALRLAPSGFLVERSEPIDPLEAYFQDEYGSGTVREVRIHDLVAAVERASDDKRINALVLRLDGLAGGMQKFAMLADAVAEFRQAGKPVHVFAHSFSQNQYLVAAEADHVTLNPEGGLFFTGFGSYPLYYRELLDELGINVNVFRVGTYKSAVEPYLRDSMSPEAREANQAMLSVLWGVYLDRIAVARDRDRIALDRLIADYPERLRDTGGDVAKLILTEGFVDTLRSEEAWRRELAKTLGAGNGNSNVGYRHIGYQRYLAATRREIRPDSDKVAVVTVRGPIVFGDASSEFAGATTVVRHMRRAVKNNSVKAIVLRVDSPGGSTLASEIIRGAVLDAKQAGKPVIASFGSVAASGGYWISANADEIWASPSTITGSIGIFGVVPTFERTLEQIGIRADGIGTAPLSGSFVPGRPLNDHARSILQQSIENGYDRFLRIVAEGRSMTRDSVDAVGQGRVWAASQAANAGLVDQIGRLDDAVAAAAALAELDDYQRVFVRDRPNTAERFLRYFRQATVEAIGQEIASTTLYSPGLIGTVRSDAKRLLDAIVADPAQRYAVCLECQLTTN